MKDAPALARELRWRVKQAMGYNSDDEGSGSKPKGSAALGTKRRRVDDQEDAPQFRNFRPKSWDSITTAAAEDNQRVMKALKPAEDDAEWTKPFILDDMKLDEGEEAMVSSRKEVVIKVRRTAQGLERQRIERTVEEWRWDS